MEYRLERDDCNIEDDVQESYDDHALPSPIACCQISHEVCEQIQVVGYDENETLVYQIHSASCNISDWFCETRYYQHQYRLKVYLEDAHNCIILLENNYMRKPKLS